MIELVYSFTVTKISTGKQRKHGGESFNFKLSGEANLFSGSSLQAGWEIFQRVCYWEGGVCINILIVAIFGESLVVPTKFHIFTSFGWDMFTVCRLG